MVREPLKREGDLFNNLTRIEEPLLELRNGGRLLYGGERRPPEDVDEACFKYAASDDPGLSCLCP